MSNPVVQEVEQKLKDELEAVHVETVDNSWMHAGHGSSGSHLVITVVSPKFGDITLIDRHRMIHQVLREEIGGVIHALELQPLTPIEWESIQAKV
ncbi:MAG: BolA family transcriptional regulator [Vampirovibrio sp.]|nr:BolA family transcriptional regulator [Vampirovibrio sp.]